MPTTTGDTKAAAGANGPPQAGTSLPDLTALRKLLEAVTLKDLVSDKQDVLTLEHDSSVGHALQMLGRHRILSAPMVIKPGLEDVETGEFDVERGPTLVDWYDLYAGLNPHQLPFAAPLTTLDCLDRVDINDILREFLAQLRSKVNPLPSSMLQLMSLLEKVPLFLQQRPVSHPVSLNGSCTLQEGPTFTDKSLITIVGNVDHGLVFQPDAGTSVLAAVKEMFLAEKLQLVNSIQVPRVVHRLAMFDPHGYIINVVSQMDVVR